jgi:hypothetical protein
MKWLAMTCALLIVASAGIVGWMTLTRRFEPEPIVPRGLGSAILGIELAESADEVHALFRDPFGCHNRDVFRGQIYEDWYFIGIYWLLLSGLGGLLAFRPSIGWRVLAGMVVLLVTVAAIFDVFENQGILAMTNLIPQELSDAAARKTREASLVKWGFSFAAIGLISIVFLGRKSVGPRFLGRESVGRVARAFATVAGICLLLASLVGLVGAVYHDWAISWAMFVLFVGLFPAFFVLSITPEIL